MEDDMLGQQFDGGTVIAACVGTPITTWVILLMPTGFPYRLVGVYGEKVVWRCAYDTITEAVEAYNEQIGAIV